MYWAFLSLRALETVNCLISRISFLTLDLAKVICDFLSIEIGMSLSIAKPPLTLLETSSTSFLDDN